MHNYTVNANLQILPLGMNRHPYVWVDEAIGVIQKSGIEFEVNAFGTVLTGTYDQVMKVINAVNEYLYIDGCEEWIVNSQIQIRNASSVNSQEKTAKFRQLHDN
jgi:uncharacterized protein YqgV (UPF0045/DUF77 family)